MDYPHKEQLLVRIIIDVEINKGKAWQSNAAQ